MAIAKYAYDPQKTGIFFDGIRISGFSADQRYTLGSSEGTHIIHLQITSDSLPSLPVGRRGVLLLEIHRGGEEFIAVNLGVVAVKGYSVESLKNEVPVIRVVFGK